MDTFLDKGYKISIILWFLLELYCFTVGDR